MRLTALHEAYWQPIADHPGQLGKLDKRAKKNDKSFLVHPEDRKRWLKWFGGGKIKEDLDDKDEFVHDRHIYYCAECDAYKMYNYSPNKPPSDAELDAYHEAHMTAEDAGHKAIHGIPDEDERNDKYFGIYNTLMAAAGYRNRKRIKEDLDDKDEFTEMPSQEQLQQAIRELRDNATRNQAAGMPGRSHILHMMERLHVQLFGEPYNPTTTPRM